MDLQRNMAGLRQQGSWVGLDRVHRQRRAVLHVKARQEKVNRGDRFTRVDAAAAGRRRGDQRESERIETEGLIVFHISQGWVQSAKFS